MGLVLAERDTRDKSSAIAHIRKYIATLMDVHLGMAVRPIY